MEPNIKKKRKKKSLVIILLSLLTLSASLILFFIKENKAVETIDESWGLGKVVTESVSNDRDYEWYVDQCNTGPYGEINCGPASMEMIAKWKNKNSTITAEGLRKKFLTDEHGTGIAIVYEVLFQNKIDYEIMDTKINASITKSATDRLASRVKDKIKNGGLVLAAIETKHLTWNPKTNERCGKYGLGNGNHFIIIKGYKVVDKKLYFETYDPYSNGWKYDDGTLWGKNRYYLASEVIEGNFGLIAIPK